MTSTKSGRASRRAFLSAAGVGALALPLVGLPGRSRAADGKFPKRLIIMTSANGTSMKHFWPGEGPLTAPRILEPLAPFAAKLVVMRGVNSETAYKTPVPPDHDPDFRNLLTARQAVASGPSYLLAGISIDQHIANAVGKETKIRSVHLGGGRTLHARGFNQPVPAESNAKNAFKKIFADLDVAPDALARQRRERANVLGTVASRLAAVRCQLGTTDRAKLEAHLDGVRDMERRLGIALPGSCKAPDMTAADDRLPSRFRLYADLVVSALACDATRVATIDLDNGGTSHSWVGVSGTEGPYHAAIAHDGSDQGFARCAEVERWVATQMAYLLEKMSAVPEGDGTMLDHSAVLWMKEQSNGSSHGRRDYPVVLAGGCGGVFKTGRTLDAKGQPHNGLLITLAQAMDVPTTMFGDPEFSKGPLVGLA